MIKGYVNLIINLSKLNKNKIQLATPQLHNHQIIKHKRCMYAVTIFNIILVLDHD